MVAEIDGHAVFHILDEFGHFILVLAASQDTGNLIAGSVAGELGRGRHKEARSTAGGIELTEIVGVELNDFPLLGLEKERDKLAGRNFIR